MNLGNSSAKRQVRIAQHRLQIPKLYQGIYEKAVSGKSRKAAMHAFCLECCGWQIKEVFSCTSPQCPLYPYRFKSRASPGMPKSISDKQESNNPNNESNG